MTNLKSWRFRLVARTHASHAWNTGSIPVGATSVRTQSSSIFFAYRSRKSTSLFCIRKSNNIGVDPKVVCHTEHSEVSLFSAFLRSFTFVQDDKLT